MQITRRDFIKVGAAGTGAAGDEVHLLELVHRLAHGETVHLEALRELDLGRQLVSGRIGPR